MTCKGFPFDCRNLVNTSDMVSMTETFMCGCSDEERARSVARPVAIRPDHRKHEEREGLFLFLGLGLEEEDCPQFAAALDRYVTRVLRSEAEWLRSLPQPKQATGLQGPYWYGQGWDDAAHELNESADRVEPVD